jgi:hypothetical protein
MWTFLAVVIENSTPLAKAHHMKDAYSNLLGEYVQAHEVDHGDISGFQIVCPCCREEIFKVARETKRKRIDFFSHYRASAAFTIDECERRVGSLSSSEKLQASETSRMHTLEMFRSVIRDATALVPIDGKPFQSDELPKRRVLLLAGIVPALKELVRDMGPTGALTDVVQKNDRAIEEVGHQNLTPFGLSFRNRIASDLVRTIFAGNSDKTVLHMAARGHASAFRLKTTLQSDHVMFDFRSRSRKLVDHPGLKKEFDSREGDRFAAYVVLDAILRELHRLPYLKMIANAKAKAHPLSGITIDDYLPDLEDGQPPVNYVSQGYDLIPRQYDGPISDLKR